MFNKSILYKIFILIFALVAGQTTYSKTLFAEIITKHTVKSEDLISIVVQIRNEDQSINTSINGNFQLISSPAILEIDIINIHRGVGSLTTKVNSSEDFIITIEGFTGQKGVLINNDQYTLVNGEISSNTTWTSNDFIFINDDLTVLNDVILTIEDGCQVFLGEKTNLFIDGLMVVNGKPDNPVFFQPFSPNHPWGGINFSNSSNSSSVEYCFFVKGGNDPNHIFGHSQSQPVLMVENSSLLLSNCFILDNPGKAIGGSHSQVSLDNCVISRCDTGGEYHFCFVSINASYYIDIPNNDGIQVDDDNDGSYFYEVYPAGTQPSSVDNCVFINGKDDGIDHNGSNLNINNCWIEGFDHEGIAASNTNNLSVYNTLVKNCEQGIEAGYGSPNVIVDHCTLVNNETGLRFGDWYDWGCYGQITATNSIIADNLDDIMNYDILTQGPVAGAINLSFSLTNDSDYLDSPNCIAGTPVFDENYYLLPGSPGIGYATDGSNLGLINPGLMISDNQRTPIFDLQIFPNPFQNRNSIRFYLEINSDVTFRVFDNYGKILFQQTYISLLKGTHIIPFQNSKMKQGLYFFTLLVNDYYISKKAIAY